MNGAQILLTQCILLRLMTGMPAQAFPDGGSLMGHPAPKSEQRLEPLQAPDFVKGVEMWATGQPNGLV